MRSPCETSKATFGSWRAASADLFAGDAFTEAEVLADLAALSPADRAVLRGRAEGERFTELADRR